MGCGGSKPKVKKPAPRVRDKRSQSPTPSEEDSYGKFDDDLPSFVLKTSDLEEDKSYPLSPTHEERRVHSGKLYRPVSGPLHAPRQRSNSQESFFKMLDEKINSATRRRKNSQAYKDSYRTRHSDAARRDRLDNTNERDKHGRNHGLRRQSDSNVAKNNYDRRHSWRNNEDNKNDRERNHSVDRLHGKQQYDNEKSHDRHRTRYESDQRSTKHCQRDDYQHRSNYKDTDEKSYKTNNHRLNQRIHNESDHYKSRFNENPEKLNGRSDDSRHHKRFDEKNAPPKYKENDRLSRHNNLSENNIRHKNADRLDNEGRSNYPKHLEYKEIERRRRDHYDRKNKRQRNLSKEYSVPRHHSESDLRNGIDKSRRNREFNSNGDGIGRKVSRPKSETKFRQSHDDKSRRTRRSDYYAQERRSY
ncbi:Uncharacterised protein g2647 [Pycnogonum litorale]